MMKVNVLLNEKTFHELIDICDNTHIVSCEITLIFLKDKLLIKKDGFNHVIYASEFDFYFVVEGTIDSKAGNQVSSSLSQLITKNYWPLMMMYDYEDEIFFKDDMYKIYFVNRDKPITQPSYRLNDIIANHGNSLDSKKIVDELTSTRVNNPYYFSSFKKRSIVNEYIINYFAHKHNLLILLMSNENLLVIYETFFDLLFPPCLYKDLRISILSFLKMNKKLSDLLPLLPDWAIEN